MKILKDKLQRNKLLLLLLGLLLYVGGTCLVIYVIYDNETLSLISKEVAQNFTYITLFVITLILMKMSKIPFEEYGLFFSKFPLQILLGILLSMVMLFSQLVFFRSIPRIPNQPIYTLISQLIVGISEETFWRGFLFGIMKEFVKLDNIIIFISALLFAVYHYPINHSMLQMVNAFAFGIVFGVIKSEFGKTTGIPTLAIAHAITNVF